MEDKKDEVSNNEIATSDKAKDYIEVLGLLLGFGSVILLLLRFVNLDGFWGPLAFVVGTIIFGVLCSALFMFVIALLFDYGKQILMALGVVVLVLLSILLVKIIFFG